MIAGASCTSTSQSIPRACGSYSNCERRCRPSLRSGHLTPTLHCENAGHGYSILINTRDALTRFPPERIFALAHSSYDHVRIQAVATGDVSILCVDEILAAQLKRTNSCSRRTG